MNKTLKGLAILSVLILASVVATAAVQVKLPEGAGKAVLEAKCQSCHSLDGVATGKMDKAGWKDTIDRMKGYGSDISDAQITTALDYLVANFSPTSAEDAQAKELIQKSCTSCHDAEKVKDVKGTKEKWTEVITTMVGMGAPLDDKQVKLVVDYLARTYPPMK